MNGFHSQSLIREKYPNITQADIRFLYSSALKRVKIDLKKELYNLTYDEFLKNTALPFALLGCKYENQYCHRDWEMQVTRYGRCLVFKPDADKFGGKGNLYGKKIALSVVAGYNQSDTSIGWFHFLTGMTLYYNDMNDSTLDNIYSVNLPPS